AGKAVHRNRARQNSSNYLVESRASESAAGRFPRVRNGRRCCDGDTRSRNIVGARSSGLVEAVMVEKSNKAPGAAAPAPDSTVNSKHHSRAFRAAIAEPWAITAEGLDLVLSIAAREHE